MLNPMVILNKRKNGAVQNTKSKYDILYTFGCVEDGVKKVVEVLAFTAKDARQKIKEGKCLVIKIIK
ncbi:MAG TPA: hypothetical protein DEG71_06320 [Clostridiales bacterium]|nr:hypothetical protein [Clostridiales bacterium]